VAVTDDLNALIDALPDGRVITDPDIVEAYRRDQTSAVVPGKPLCVVSARGTGEVAATMRWASEHGVPVVPRGGGTGLPAGRRRATAA
jgi:glycolate oxidase